MRFKSVLIAKSFLLNGCFIFGGGKKRGKLMVIEKAVEVDADSSQFPSNWIFHNREKKPGKAFVDGKKIDFITAGGRTTAYVPELQKLYGKDAEKAAKVRPAKRGVKPKEDDGDGEEDEQETEKEDESAKSKKGQKPRGGRGKKPASKTKTEESDDDGDDSEAEEEVVKPKGRGTKPAIKRKSEEKATSQAGKKPKGRKS